MDTARTVYTVDAPDTASDVAGETAAALAAASIAFRSSDPGYSDTLLRTSTRVFDFADSYRGAYSDNSNIRNAVCPFYCDFDGYQASYFANHSIFMYITKSMLVLCLVIIMHIYPGIYVRPAPDTD